MENYFVYDRFVTGRNFIGRPRECMALENLLRAGENTVIYEPPYSGKRSLIQNVLLGMNKGKNITILGVDIDNIRSTASLLTKFGSAIIRPIASTPVEYDAIIREHLAGTHFVFDEQRFASVNEAVSLKWDPDPNDIVRMFSLPSSIAKSRNEKSVTIIEEFQSVNRLNDSDAVMRGFKEALKTSSADGNVFIISGSRYNEMKTMFRYQPFFHGLVEHLPLNSVDDREIIDHMVKSFNVTGKSLEGELALGAARLFRGNMWYINHLCALCDYLTKGYVNRGIMMSAFNHMINIHRGRFEYIMDNLTDYQINFLNAMVDGVDRFTSSEVIRKYSLNSSANVARVKEALFKKEIITNNDRDELIVIDPLFEYWVKRYYFEKEEDMIW